MGVCRWHHYRCNCSLYFKVCFFLIFVFFKQTVNGEVISKFESKNEIAITFDACETKTPAYFDEKILHFIVEKQIPVTIFVNEKFALRNLNMLKKIGKFDFIEIENHSANHYQYMQKLDNETIVEEVLANEKFLYKNLGIKTKFFRFPGFNYDRRAVEVVESLKYKIIHANLISGDPDKNITAEKMSKYIGHNLRPGDILIFHINGRGYNTHKALPEIYNIIKNRGFTPVRLDKVVR
ncbi:MAG: polysaccharide deacetylase [Deferribacteraceae bacterium]|jgi:peptidoglycan/xylan/chitin deacetylase (PgdA/CDA1 family)|nr:polysaccharide deacetylase [Deferribacteraceae bacterium]